MESIPGMKWVKGFHGLDTRWTTTPSERELAQLVASHLDLPDPSLCLVSRLDEGALSFVYKVETPSKSVVVKVVLPVDLPLRVQSEVATTGFIAAHGGVPVARILAYDASNDNCLGFAWIMMEYIQGSNLRAKWRTMSMEKKQQLVLEVARFQARIYSFRYNTIGSQHYVLPPRYPDDFSQTRITTSFFMGLAITACFFPALTSCCLALFYVRPQFDLTPLNPRSVPITQLGPISSRDFLFATPDITRGPFSCIRDWVHARLLTVLAKQKLSLIICTDEDQVYITNENNNLVHRLLDLLLGQFPPFDTSPYSHRISLHDLHVRNIMLDPEDNLAAIIDWECISTAPAWMACTIPPFLDEEPRHVEPQRSEYGPGGFIDPTDIDKLDAEGCSMYYWSDLYEYEVTQLRPLFFAEIERLQPEWISHYNQRLLGVQSDFVRIVQMMERGMCWDERPIEWVTRLEKGEDVTGVLNMPEEDYDAMTGSVSELGIFVGD